MRAILNGVGWICTLGCAGITLLANFYYGLHVASGHERWAFAVGGAFLDGLKTVLPIALGTLLLGRITVGAFARLSLGIVFWLGLVAWSLFCAMQLYESSRVGRVGEVEAGKVSYAQHKADKLAAESEITRLRDAKSAEVLRAELDALKLDKLYARSKQCADATAAESRDLCKRKVTLEGQVASAMTADEIKEAIRAQAARLKHAGAGMNAGNLAEVLSISDPGTKALADAFGIDVETLRYRLALGFAALLEFGGGLGGWLMTGGHLPACRRKEWPNEDCQVEVPTPARREIRTEPVVEPAPISAAAIWSKEFIVARKGTFTPSSEVRDAFNSWAAVNGHEQLNATAFGKEMTALGFERDKRGGVQIYVDIALLVPKASGLRVVADNTKALGPMTRRSASPA